MNTASSELGLVLEVGQDVRQLDVSLVERYGGRGGRFIRVHSGAADGEVGFAPLQAGLGDNNTRGLKRLDASH